MKSELKNICDLINEKISANELINNNLASTYVSTESMLPNKRGITKPSSIPSKGTTTAYKKDDVLVSNIRPYFKKIWSANYDGVCSNDVLVFRAKNTADANFLYYVFANDDFFVYSMATSKGTKMPRGDKASIMKYEVESFDLNTQRKIASILKPIDKKIELNNAINNNLLQQLDTLYDEFSHRKNWSTVIINDIAEKVAMGPFGSNIKVSTFVSEGVPIISGNHLRGYFLEEPSFNYITEEHAQRLKNSLVYPKDIVFTHAGNIGQVAMIPDDCRYPMYVLSQRQFYLRCDTEKAIPEYVVLFFHSKQGQHELLSYANQTGVPSIAQPATNLKKIPLKLPPIDEQRQWLQVVSPIIKLYQSNVYENEHLSSMRDSLLPKLMSGELDVSDIDL